MSRRAILLAGLILILWATLVFVTGGVAGTVLGIRVSLHSGVRPLALAAILFGVGVFLHGWRAFDADADWLARWASRLAAPTAAAVAIVVLCVGLRYDTKSAGGSDPYGYVSEADLWLNLHLRVAQPFVSELPIPFADRAFAPLGYAPVGDDHVIVPTYPPGLPLLMALAKLTAGRAGLFAVVPILGATAIWLCYLLGARVASPVVGAVAAIALAASPAFLFMLMQPMSDIPAAAFWTAAILFTLGSKRFSAPLAGACCAAAIVIRPNLAPLAAIPFGYLLWTRGGWRTFALAVVPGAALVAAFNAHLYGSPLASGYGEVHSLYAWRNASINLRQYSGWLLDTQTPIVFASLAALLWTRPRRIPVLFVLFIGGVFSAYLFYAPFDAWWYLRFLLPMFPLLLILTAAGAVAVTARIPRLLQVLAWTIVPVLVLGYQIDYAVSRGVFAQREAERRYEIVGHYVAASTPANAVLLSMQHSGSLRYYGHRTTLRYDSIAPESLDSTIALLREKGYRPFIVLDEWEVPVFRGRFALSETGRLAWAPMADFSTVRVYEPPPR